MAGAKIPQNSGFRELVDAQTPPVAELRIQWGSPVEVQILSPEFSRPPSSGAFSIGITANIASSFCCCKITLYLLHKCCNLAKIVLVLL